MKPKHDLLDDGMPAALETEGWVIAQAILDGERTDGKANMPYLRTRVPGEYFTTERNRRAWECACAMFDAGEPITSATLAMAIHERFHEVIVVGLEGYPWHPNPAALVQRLAEKAEARRFITACEHGRNEVLGGLAPAEAVESLLSNSQVSKEQSDLQHTGKIIEERGLEDLLHGSRQWGMRLPWPQLNHILHGLHPGQLVILAAHTSQGKTSAALQIATEAARQSLAPVFFSLEMRPDQLLRRMITQVSGVPRREAEHDLDFGNARSRERAAANWLCENPVWMDGGSHTVPAMLTSLRCRERGRPLGLVVVDYLQLVQTTGRQEYRARDIGNMARELKMAAQSLNVPFLVLSQFSRESAKEGRRPELYDLKESGDLENHADVVIILHATQLDTASPERMVTFYVPKQREGPRGREVSMIFKSDIQTFEESQP